MPRSERHNLLFVFIPLVLSVLLALGSSVIEILIVVLMLSLIVILYGEKAILFMVLVGFITSINEYVGEIRFLIIFFSSGALLFLFAKRFGLNIKLFPKVPKGIIIFLIMLFTSYSLSAIFSASPLNSMIFITNMCLFIIICYLLYALITDETVMIYLASMIFSIIILAILLIIDFAKLGTENFFRKAILDGSVNLAGSKGYTGFTVLFIAFTFLVALIFMMKKKGLAIYLFYSLLLINIITLILANSRTALVGAILSITVMFFQFYKTKTIKFILLILVCFFSFYFLLSEFRDSIDLYLRLDSINQREIFYQAGFEVALSNPIFGVGPGMFDKYFFSYAPSNIFEFFDLDIWRYGKPTPHNLFLYYWAENGILGLGLVVSFFTLYFYYAIKTLKVCVVKSDKNYILTVSFIGIGIGMVFRSFFEVSGALLYGYITTDITFWIVFSILIYLYNKGEKLSKKLELV